MLQSRIIIATLYRFVHCIASGTVPRIYAWYVSDLFRISRRQRFSGYGKGHCENPTHPNDSGHPDDGTGDGQAWGRFLNLHCIDGLHRLGVGVNHTR